MKHKGTNAYQDWYLNRVDCADCIDGITYEFDNEFGENCSHCDGSGWVMKDGQLELPLGIRSTEMVSRFETDPKVVRQKYYAAMCGIIDTWCTVGIAPLDTHKATVQLNIDALVKSVSTDAIYITAACNFMGFPISYEKVCNILKHDRVEEPTAEATSRRVAKMLRKIEGITLVNLEIDNA